MATEILRPNGDAYVNWTRSTGSYNYACVDEAVKDEADYVSMAASYNTDEYTVSAPTAIQPGDTINSVTVHVVAKLTAGDRELAIGFYISEEHNEVTDALHLTSSYVDYEETWTGFTYSELADLHILFFSSTTAGTIRVCQAWIEVDYTPSASFGGGSFHRGVGRGFF